MSRTPLKTSRLISGYLLWLVIGTTIGALVSALACWQFQLHVRMFYPPGVPNSWLMRKVAEIAVGLQPFALVGPAVGPFYFCWRNGLAKVYLVMCAVTAAVLAAFLSGSIQGAPDQPIVFNVPASVFVATIVALIIQAVRGDWVAHEITIAHRARSVRSREQRSI